MNTRLDAVFGPRGRRRRLGLFLTAIAVLGLVAGSYLLTCGIIELPGGYSLPGLLVLLGGLLLMFMAFHGGYLLNQGLLAADIIALWNMKAGCRPEESQSAGDSRESPTNCGGGDAVSDCLLRQPVDPLLALGEKKAWRYGLFSIGMLLILPVLVMRVMVNTVGGEVERWFSLGLTLVWAALINGVIWTILDYGYIALADAVQDLCASSGSTEDKRAYPHVWLPARVTMRVVTHDNMISFLARFFVPMLALSLLVQFGGVWILWVFAEAHTMAFGLLLLCLAGIWVIVLDFYSIGSPGRAVRTILDYARTACD